MDCQETRIIIGLLNFTEPVSDSKTLPEVLEQYERLTGKEAAEVFVFRGYKGASQYKRLQTNVPKPDKDITKQKRKKHGKRRPSSR